MTKRHEEAVQHSSKDSGWRTPLALFSALDEEFRFLVDAAANETNHLCKHWFGPGCELDEDAGVEYEDALKIDWEQYLTYYYADLEHLTVFLNPPFSRQQKIYIEDWVEKCWIESQKGLTIVALIPYSPQTEWWRKYVEGHQAEEEERVPFFAAREVRKLPFRVSFLRPDGSLADNAGNNTAVVIWKPRWGLVSPWVPWSCYWEYPREAKERKHGEEKSETAAAVGSSHPKEEEDHLEGVGDRRAGDTEGDRVGASGNSGGREEEV